MMHLGRVKREETQSKGVPHHTNVPPLLVNNNNNIISIQGGVVHSSHGNVILDE